MSEQITDPGRDNAWGDLMMPEEAAQRQGGRDAPAHTPDSPHPPDSRATSGAPDPNPRGDSDLYTFGATSARPSPDARYARLPLGPGNEAMEGGASPAPRGYTGGAMGKFVAGLSPSFAEAARGEPPPGGDQFYTASEAATTFGPGSGIAHPTAQPPPEFAPTERPNNLDTPTDSGTG